MRIDRSGIHNPLSVNYPITKVRIFCVSEILCSYRRSFKVKPENKEKLFT